MTITAGNIECGVEKKLATDFQPTVGSFNSRKWIVSKTGVYRPVVKLRVIGFSGAAKAYLKKVVDGGSDINLATTSQINNTGTDVNIGTDVSLTAGDRIYVFLDVTNSFNQFGAKAKGALGISTASAAKSNIDRQDAQTGDLMGNTNVGDMFA